MGAHPDDIEIGCAGSLLKYHNVGFDIYLMVMTLGDKGGDHQIRENEQIRSAEIMKASDLIWGGYEDTQLSLHMDTLVSDIESHIKKIKPTFLFVNYVDDSHQDHRTLCKAAISASRNIRNVLFYEVPTTHDFSPSIFVDIRDTMDIKIDALLAHASQMEKTNIEGLSIIDIAQSTAVFRGIQGKVARAEGFVPLRLLVNV